ncbi:aldo/keto reductase [Phytoactinopolyspora alkaliphila]|uniref:Aldo/keto reductase n=1 Tax=Phytoactinopolyspora alkaliphila TaxID=1783498 RepID=A0A6N9YKB4_9ACTN|nr:aldo/keto reductase [Phytoactinopolyspora alkaliphila]NED95309.1 aldo/keto reductase [Phytoactinopolyspora alkaliphila]
MTTSTAIPEVKLTDGHDVPILGFGTWQMTGDVAYHAVLDALKAGYRHLDTATAYDNEAQVGRALRDSGLAREDVFITTKLPPGRAGEERATLSASLRELGVDYVDLWLVHWPPDGQPAPGTWAEFIALRDEGLTRSIGVSNYSTGHLDQLVDATGVAPAVNQIKWSPLLHDPARLAELRDRGVAVEGYSPFRAGDLDASELVEIAERHGITPAQVVLRWHIQHEIVVIPKSQDPDRLRSNLDVFGFSLTDDEMSRIDGLAR